MSTEINNLLYVDPNGDDRNKTELEDLNIFVELKVFTRSDDMIKFNNQTGKETYSKNEASNNATRISFIDNDSTNESKSYLTTLYTEVGSEFSQSNQNPDLGTLGIESIDISFNSSLAPVVNIRFKDVRGRLMSMGKKSPYAFLFRMPYPIFYLTIKGYYGKAVQYALHMTEFNGELDNDTGSYIINTNFIGYTYAYLSDLLMGYLKAIPYTKIGSKLVSEDPDYISFSELQNTIQTINKTVDLYKQDSNIKALKLYTDLIEKLETLRSSMNSMIQHFKSENNGVILPENANVCFIKSKGTKPLVSLYENQVLSIVNEYNEFARNTNSTFALDVGTFALNSGGVYFSDIYYTDFINNSNPTYSEITWDNYQDTEAKTTKEYFSVFEYQTTSKVSLEDGVLKRFKATDESLSNYLIKNDYEGFNALLSGLNFKTSFDTSPVLDGVSLISKDELQLDVFDFRLAMNVIDDTLERVRNVEGDKTTLVYDDFVRQIEEAISDKSVFKFDSSIGKLFEVLCNHADIFVESIRMVGYEVNQDLLQKKRPIDRGLMPEYNVDQFKAFPDFLSNEGTKNAYVDSWIGARSKYKNIPEVRFVEDLYQAILKKTLEEQSYLDSLVQEETSWYPVNPLDSKILDDTAVNPWSLVENSNAEIIHKLMLERMVTFLGLSVKNPSNSEIIDMASIEANQAFNAIKKSAVKLTVVPTGITRDKALALGFKNMLDTNTKFGLKIVRNGETGENVEEYGIIDAILDINLPGVPGNGLGTLLDVFDSNDEIVDMSEISSPYEYTYSGVDLRDSISPNRNFIPIRQTLPNIINTNNPILLTKENNGEVPSTTVFSSPMVGQYSKDGEYLIKIIENEKYKNEDLYPNFSHVIKNNAKNLANVTSKLPSSHDNEIENVFDYNYIYGGSYKTADFSTYTKVGFPMGYEFYNNTINATGKFVGMLGTKKDVTIFDTFIESSGSYIYNTNVKQLDDTRNIPKLNEAYNHSNGFRSVIKEKFDSDKKEPTNNYKFTFSPKMITNHGEVDLFGSEFYYAQTTDIAKAFLFLHSLPFDGTSRRGVKVYKDLFNTKLVNLFNKRAGFINAPKSWIYFLGALIYRMDYSTDIITFLDSDGNSLIPSNTADQLNISKTQYLSVVEGIGLISFPKIHQSAEYYEISDIIKNLPTSVKDLFKTEFLNWVNNTNGFGKIKNALEIFNSATTTTDRQNAWDNLAINNFTQADKWNGNIANNYVVVSQDLIKTSKGDPEKGPYNNFLLRLRDGNRTTIDKIPTGSGDLIDFLLETKTIVNGTYRIWDETINNKLLMRPSDVSTYLRHFYLTFSSLNKSVNLDTTPTDEDNLKVFKTANVNDIKLSIYKNVKSFYDKWVVGVNSDTPGIISEDLYTRFKIIDRSYGDISDTFKVSPFGLSKHLTSSNNVSFYNFIATILKDNNFDFHPLPSFVDYSDANAVKEIFEPTRFHNIRPTTGPSFICMYIGERSNRLDIVEEDGNNKNDGMKVSTSGVNTMGIDYTSDKPKIPYFVVSYADQNQSIFKKLTLDQKEFTETHEGLQIMENISKGNKNDSIGQNLFDIYNNRSYSAGIEMLGCAEIQPFMYFQLDNVPMFNGAYTVLNVTHRITPNHMTTNFKGYRIRKAKTKMVDNHTLFMNLFVNLDGIDTEGASFRDLTIGTPTFVSGSTINIDPSSQSFSSPVRIESTISDSFGYRKHPITGVHGNHNGVDIKIPVGTPLYAPGPGAIVSKIRFQKDAAGLYVDVIQDIGDRRYTFRMMHLSFVPKEMFNNGKELSDYPTNDSWTVNPNKKLYDINTVVAYSGGANGNVYSGGSTGPHLHLETFEKWPNFQDPIGVIKNMSNYKFEPYQLNTDSDEA